MDRTEDLVSLLEAVTLMANSVVAPASNQQANASLPGTPVGGDPTLVPVRQDTENTHDVEVTGHIQDTEATNCNALIQGEQENELPFSNDGARNTDPESDDRSIMEQSRELWDVKKSQSMCTDLDLAICSLNHVYKSIERDLCTAERDIGDDRSPHTEAFLYKMRDFSNNIDKEIKHDLSEAAENSRTEAP